MVNEYEKKCSESPIIREMQIKTTTIYHLISVTMVIMKQIHKPKDDERRGCGDIGTSILLVGMQNAVAAMENRMEAP